MGKYSRINRPMEKSHLNRDIHPIWRGVGFALIVLILVQAYFLGNWFVDENAKTGWIQFPQQLYFSQLPDPALLVRIITIAAIALVSYAIFTFLALLVLRMVAPPRYGPLDVPPVTYRGRQYKR